MAAFPSVKWFDDVRQIFNNDESFRGGGGGLCNCVAGIKVGDEIFILSFEGFECVEARQANMSDLDEVDFYLDMGLYLMFRYIYNGLFPIFQKLA